MMDNIANPVGVEPQVAASHWTQMTGRESKYRQIFQTHIYIERHVLCED